MPAVPVFDNSYERELPGFFTRWQADEAPAPRLLKLNEPLARSLGFDPAVLEAEDAARIFSGNHLLPGMSPIAQAYAGHQFGGFSPQLGDGRALLLGEITDGAGLRRDVHLKGSGRTPFSRGADGKAAIGPVLREYVIGEAMHALGIPTTRAIAAVLTGEQVRRETLLPGAILARIAASHIRVGTFQFFAARGASDKVKQLADYAIARHYPEIGGEDRYLAFFRAVCAAQARLIAQWMLVGFVHGVMNTDNMTISGETIDYGPCAFIDAYDPRAVFSSIDSQGRYAFGNQPAIGQWNLARLAECLIDLVDTDRPRAIERLTEVLNDYPGLYESHWLAGMRGKLGMEGAEDGDDRLAQGLLSLMEEAGADFTLTFRALSSAVRGVDGDLRQALGNGPTIEDWLGRWRARLAIGGRPPGQLAAGLDRVNPLFTPRNHKVEEALAAATDRGDLTLFDELLSFVSAPYTDRPDPSGYGRPPPPGTPPCRTFCGT